MLELNMRIERIENNWTLDYVGEQLNITNQAVSKLETGKTKPSYDVLCKTEKLFNKKHDYLFAVSNRNTPINQKNDTTTSKKK